MRNSAKNHPRNFAKRHPVGGGFWAEVEVISLLDAACLTLNLDPWVFAKELEASGELVSLDMLPENFLNRIEVLRTAILAGTLIPLALSHDKLGQIDENKTRIKTDDFVAWCAAKRLPHNIPNRATPQPTTKWPWGDYETKLLLELAAAADKFWKNYDPADLTTAPTNKQVKDWLKARSVAQRTADVIASILRADGLPTGPRK